MSKVGQVSFQACFSAKVVITGMTSIGRLRFKNIEKKNCSSDYVGHRI